MTKQKGFTLIELLVVIAILAVLATVTALILNPAELLAQGRDSSRVSDINTIAAGMNLYLTDKAGAYTLTALANFTCAAGSTPFKGYTYGTSAPTLGTFLTKTNGGTGSGDCPQTAADRTVSATGWLPVNLSGLTSGTPFGSEPVDPTNSVNFIYRFNIAGNAAGTTAVTTTALNYEADAVLESVKYNGSTTYYNKTTATTVCATATSRCYAAGNATIGTM